MSSFGTSELKSVRLPLALHGLASKRIVNKRARYRMGKGEPNQQHLAATVDEKPVQGPPVVLTIQQSMNNFKSTCFMLLIERQHQQNALFRGDIKITRHSCQ